MFRHDLAANPARLTELWNIRHSGSRRHARTTGLGTHRCPSGTPPPRSRRPAQTGPRPGERRRGGRTGGQRVGSARRGGGRGGGGAGGAGERLGWRRAGSGGGRPGRGNPAQNPARRPSPGPGAAGRGAPRPRLRSAHTGQVNYSPVPSFALFCVLLRLAHLRPRRPDRKTRIPRLLPSLALGGRNSCCIFVYLLLLFGRAAFGAFVFGCIGGKRRFGALALQLQSMVTCKQKGSSCFIAYIEYMRGLPDCSKQLASDLAMRVPVCSRINY